MSGAPTETTSGETELTAFLASAPALLLTLDNDTCILRVSTRWLRESGHSACAVYGRSFLDFCAPTCRSRVREDLLRVVTSGVAARSLATLVDGSGAQRTLWLDATPGQVTHDNRTASLSIALSAVATPSAKWEAGNPGLLDGPHERRLAARLFEWAPEAIVLADPGRRVVRINRAAEHLFGWRSEEIQGRLTKLFYYDEADFHESALTHFGPNAEPRGAGRRVRYRRRDGRMFLGETIGNPVRTDDGELEGFVGITRDVTREVQAREELAATNRHLQATLDALDQFAYIASHDLRTPLRGVAHLARFIKDEAPRELLTAIEPRLKQLDNRVRKMDSMLMALMRYARTSYDATAIESTRIADVLAQTVSTLRNAHAGSKQILVDLEIAREVPPELYLDRLVLEQTLQNLMDNGVKHHDLAFCRLRVTVEFVEPFVWFHLQDDGPGIPARQHERVFQIFRTLGHDSPNTGLGLALLQRLVLRAGGMIRLTSPLAIDRGARFSFSLPVRTDPPPDALHPSTFPPPPNP